jgi:hypothetical protein
MEGEEFYFWFTPVCIDDRDSNTLEGAWSDAGAYLVFLSDMAMVVTESENWLEKNLVAKSHSPIVSQSSLVHPGPRTVALTTCS